MPRFGCFPKRDLHGLGFTYGKSSFRRRHSTAEIVRPNRLAAACVGNRLSKTSCALVQNVLRPLLANSDPRLLFMPDYFSISFIFTGSAVGGWQAVPVQR